MDLVIGTAGHIDHGKTSLVRALTGTDADRLPEEKKRGITIDIGFAELTLGERRLAFVDVPGHEKFVKNMLAGASGIDAVLLVVAADDGVMPQTREHFDICRLLGVTSGLIAITKTDLVDSDSLELARLDTAEMVAGTFLENAPVVAVSSRTGSGIDELKTELTRLTEHQRTAPTRHLARLPIDRAFTVKGFGTVVTGTLAAGTLTDGEEVGLLPDGKKIRIRGIESHGRKVERADAGSRTAVNLAAVEISDVERGMQLVRPGLVPTLSIDARLEVLPDAVRGVRSRQRLRVHLGTAEVLARVRVLDAKNELRPGEAGMVQLRLERPAVAVINDRFIVRSYSPQRTIGGGVVLNGAAPRHRARAFAEVKTHLDAIASADGPEAILLELIRSAGRRGVETAALVARTGIEPSEIRTVLDDLCRVGTLTTKDGVYFDASAVPQATVAEPVAPAGPVLAPEDAALLERLIALIADADLAVPRIEDALSSASNGAGPKDIRKLLAALSADGRMHKATDEFYFSSDAVAAVAEKVRCYADTTDERLIDVPRFKEIAGVSRKYAIPLLELFDRIGVTRRFGERRVVLK